VKFLLVLVQLLVKVTPTMKRIYVLLVLVSLFAGVVLTGCGNNESSGGGTTNTTTTTTTTTTATNAPANTNR